MSELIRTLKEQGKECPGFLFELNKISGFPEQFQPHYLSVLLRTFRNEMKFRHPSVQEEWQKAITILTAAGVRPATMVDDIAHQVASELYLKSKLKSGSKRKGSPE